MDSRYNLLNDCLKVLRRCEMPSIQKLRLEVQLFQIKLLLLNDEVDGEIKRRYCSEYVLQEVHHLMVGLRDEEVTSGSIEAVSQRLQQIQADVGGTELLAPE